MLYDHVAAHVVRFPAATYHEPFLGGAALFLYLRDRGDHRLALLSDVNADLVELYQVIARHPHGVCSQLEVFAHGHDKAKYLRIREAWNGIRDTWSPCRRAAATLYLNRACFNGMWRVNASGAFNTPCGDRLALPTFDQLFAVSEALKWTGIGAMGFVQAMTAAQPGDVIYCDPPYLALSATANFSSYAAGGFGFAEHETLAAVSRELVRRGVFVMLSNADVPATYALYPADDWNREIVSVPRRISAKGSGRGIVTELVITPKQLGA